MMPPTNPHWHAVAEELRKELQAARYGSKSEIIRRYSEQTGYHPASLRRDVMAIDFIQAMEKSDPAFAAILRKLGSSVVLELARLHATDPKGALEAALAAVAGARTRRELSARRKKHQSMRREEIRAEAMRAFEHVRFFELLEDFGRPPSLEGSTEGELETGIHFSKRAGSCFAYCRLKGTRGTFKQLLPYLGLSLYYGRVVLAIDVPRVPKEWLRALSSSYSNPGMTLYVNDVNRWLPAHPREVD